MTLKDIKKSSKVQFRTVLEVKNKKATKRSELGWKWMHSRQNSGNISSEISSMTPPFYLFQPPLPMPSAKVLQVTFSSKPVMDSQDLHVRFRFTSSSSSDKECVSKQVKNWREGIGRNVKMQMTVNMKVNMYMNENELYKMTTRRTVTNCLLRLEMVAL